MRRAALLLALFLVAAPVAAQSPLDRRITVHLRDVALRDALDRVALLATIRLSYSGDNLPLDRRVSVDRDTSRLSEVLSDLVRGYSVQPVAVGADHVVLTLRPDATDSTSPQNAIAVLERVVVTGSVIGASERPLPIALDVVPGRDIERRNETALSEVLGGSIPGMWLWENTPTTLLARYGSIRGASSFGLSFPKIYVDGIEVANPLLLTQITPELVERVEVIRGPQGAALYGTDAISGVVNIVSRHEGAGPDGNRAFLRSNLGYSASRYTATSANVQEHSLTIRSGSNLRSAGLTLGGSSSGQYIPQAYSRELRAVADARLIAARSKLTANLRFQGKNAGVPLNPLLAPFAPDSIEADSRPQQLRLYAGGSTFTYVPNDRWTYSVTAGLDGYNLANVSNEISPVPSVADTALRNANGSAVRGTLRANAVAGVGAAERTRATVTLGAERSDLWDWSLGELPPSGGSSGPGPEPEFDRARRRSSNSGVLAQAVVGVRDAAFVTAGLRGERISQSNGRMQNAALPLLGVAFVQDFTRVSVKWRAGYGKGIRPARSTLHAVTREPKYTLHNPNLDPEEQSGIEFGTDLRVGRWLGIHLTRFDQLVSGLIQTVTVTNPSSSGSGGRDRSWYQVQNVGEITNRGWETQASVSFRALSFGGAATLVDSKVRRLANRYTGDLRAGDRMLAVPARTVSGTGSFAGRRGLQLSATVSRASDWVNYDRYSIASALSQGLIAPDSLIGGKLRRFWVNYPGATRLRSTASFTVWRGLVLNVTGDNLLNYQLGEPDTITIVPGRTITVGVKARF